jgi:hypothetical protein
MKVLSLGLEVNPETDINSETLIFHVSISGSEISGSASDTSSPRVIDISCLNGRTKMGGPLFTLKASSWLFIIKAYPADAILSVVPS